MMRKLLALAATSAVATVAFGATPALAACPGADGTVPGQPAKATAAGPFYVDDRDFADANDNGDAGGLWIYMESGVATGLQRGGDQLAFKEIKSRTGQDPAIPYHGAVVVPVANPTTGQPILTLFPQGVGGGSLSETAGSHDDCQQGTAAQRDNIVF